MEKQEAVPKESTFREEGTLFREEGINHAKMDSKSVLKQPPRLDPDMRLISEKASQRMRMQHGLRRSLLNYSKALPILSLSLSLVCMCSNSKPLHPFQGPSAASRRRVHMYLVGQCRRRRFLPFDRAIAKFTAIRESDEGCSIN